MIPSFKKLWILVLFVLAGYSSKAQITDAAHVRTTILTLKDNSPCITGLSFSLQSISEIATISIHH